MLDCATFDRRARRSQVPRPSLIFEKFLSARAFFRDPVAYVRRTGGDALLSLRAGPTRFAAVRHPDDARRVLVVDAPAYRVGRWKRRARRFLGATLNTLDGDDHRVRRAALRPVLERERVARFGAALAARAGRMAATFEPGALDLRRALDPLSVVMAGEVLLSHDLHLVAADLAAALATIMVAVPRLGPPIRLTARGRALARVGRVLDDLVAARRAAPRPPDDPDLVDVLLGLGLTEPLLRGELTAFLLAAADEPPSALAAVWYLLGRHPEAERRVLEERDRVIGHRVPEPDDEARLPYLGAVIREALRLFPPARHIDRCPVHAVELGATTVPAGTEVLVSPLVLHHDPRWFPDPSAFRPERWLDRPSSGPPRGAYLPFGAGAHACIGEPLARAITWITLVTVSRDWRLRVGPGAPPPVPRAPRLVVELERR